MKRRTVIAGAGSVGLAGLAGCTSLLRDGPTTFEASPGGVAAATREETGYEETGVEDARVEREFEAAGQSATVVVINYVTEHEKAVEVGSLLRQPAAVFVVLSTPKVEVLGEEFNPVAEMSTADLVDLVGDNYDDIGDPEHDEDGTVTILDQETTRSRFTADATFAGVDLPVDLHVTEAVAADGDLLVTVGAYPRELRPVEEGNVIELMESVVGTADGERE
ncbi:DUF6517 family protein [Salinilacihabitans rarus]|uniref:DUF6517 family protein n=1 Tax=Salinilacihabitans rarus TaxID=2961596 RepID=UPI0020C8F16B|nr:DUF6517 family protein [Salinilacihabitans rarus]